MRSGRKGVINTCVAGLALAGVAGPAWADDAAELAQMREEMRQLRAEVAQMRAQQQGDWLNEARRGEIQQMIDDAFADAQSRGSLVGDSITAGINEKGRPFLMSADGTFTAEFHGLIQMRYIWNSLDTDNTSGTRASDSLSGFQVRRVRAGVEGGFGDGWGYKIRIATQRTAGGPTTGATSTAPANGFGNGDVFTEEFYISYTFDDNWSMKFGVDQLPFARQEMVNARFQVAVDRALATEFFTLNRADLFQVNYRDDDLSANLALSDGGNNKFSGVFSDNVNDFAVTGRVDWQVLGDDWGQNKNEFAGVALEDALFVGGAVHYQVTEGVSTRSAADSGLAWTVDALYKSGPIALSAAFFGQHTDNVNAPHTDQYGFYAQCDYKIAEDWNVFARWDFIDDDGLAGANTDELQAVTIGINHDFNAWVRLTTDVVWIYAGDAPAADGNFVNGGDLSSSMGLTRTGFTAADDHDDQVALRVQLQVLF